MAIDFEQRKLLKKVIPVVEALRAIDLEKIKAELAERPSKAKTLTEECSTSERGKCVPRGMSLRKKQKRC
jgi:hypothetical protein